MQDSISFRPLGRSDFPLLQKWLSAPHVAVWWGEPLDLEAVDGKYGPRVDGTEPTHVFVIEYDGQPVGWIQWYLWSDYPEHALQLRVELPNETLIYSFKRDGVDGQSPNGVVLDGAGNLYGTTLYGGNNNDFGTVFELSQSRGVWTETVLYNSEYYNGNHDGAYPYAGVTLDKAGHLYGTTNYGGAGTDCHPGSCGAVYELEKSSGTWKELVLYSFRGGRDGSLPQAGVTLDAAGNLYGTTSFGGGGACTLNGTTGCGTFFELQKSGAKWVEKAVRLDGKNGANPQAGVILGKNGEVFGTTLYGGTGSCQGNLPGCGVVFELIP
jgi:uncharacterized repeat protein (TIGR03803 family)